MRSPISIYPNKYDSTYPNNEPRTSAAGTVDVIEEFTARAYIANLCGDIMMNYDCDGIILDRIRYPQTSPPRVPGPFP